ncbi:hypothetical protein E2C01_064862 [Portunus trituberculatus]|uniref:Uncharacterized protein n=1 Tax=Portunus trituberculatus TaxID=210409 RepID=A0A5B7HPJ1_PORTR|nr:hypothetical protein [Portunus trituberculatus]
MDVGRQFSGGRDDFKGFDSLNGLNTFDSKLLKGPPVVLKCPFVQQRRLECIVGTVRGVIFRFPFFSCLFFEVEKAGVHCGRPVKVSVHCGAC